MSVPGDPRSTDRAPTARNAPTVSMRDEHQGAQAPRGIDQLVTTDGGQIHHRIGGASAGTTAQLRKMVLPGEPLWANRS